MWQLIAIVGEIKFYNKQLFFMSFSYPPPLFFRCSLTSDQLRQLLLERGTPVMKYLRPLYSILIGPATTVKHSYLLVGAAYLLWGHPI